MSKRKIFFDMDGVIVNIQKAFCEVYNSEYKDYPNFIPADWTKNNKWNLKDVCPLIKSCEDIFNSAELFYKLEFMDKYTFDVLKRLSEDYRIIICSAGSHFNISYKATWIKNKLPFVKEAVLLYNTSKQLCAKGELTNMQDSIFVDDLNKNLLESNAFYRICFGEEFAWNANTPFTRCRNFKELERIISTLF